MKLSHMIAAGLFSLLATTAHARQGGTIDRLYVLDCGNITVADQGRFISPGVNDGKPIHLLDNCYLIKKGKDWLLWETGYPDAILGQTPPPGPIQGYRTVTLMAQLEKIGVKPADLKYVMVSHTHRDHIGNVDLFPQVPVLIQKSEYDFAFTPAKKPPFSPDHPTRKVEGDLDLFGDGSVTILATPGHTPGHQSLLVRLKKTGYVVLTGDAVQTADTWTHRWAPGENVQGIKASMDRLEQVVKQHRAQIWSNHDPEQGAQQRKARAYFD